MNREKLKLIDIMPFDAGAMADGMGSSITEREDLVKFAVMLRYLELLARQMEIPVEIPVMTEYLKRDDGYYGRYSDPGIRKSSIMNQLYDSIMLGTGWCYGISKVNGENLEEPRIYPSENSSILSWIGAISLVPEILELEKEGFEGITITVCWNTRVAGFLQFVAANPGKVKFLFGDEEAMIRCILRKMADPYAVGKPVQCFKGGSYVMAYFEGTSDEITVSSKDMDYNFFVQGMVLHLLLSRAEELFGLSGDGVRK